MFRFFAFLLLLSLCWAETPAPAADIRTITYTIKKGRKQAISFIQIFGLAEEAVPSTFTVSWPVLPSAGIIQARPNPRGLSQNATRQEARGYTQVKTSQEFFTSPFFIFEAPRFMNISTSATMTMQARVDWGAGERIVQFKIDVTNSRPEARNSGFRMPPRLLKLGRSIRLSIYDQDSYFVLPSREIVDVELSEIPPEDACILRQFEQDSEKVGAKITATDNHLTDLVKFRLRVMPPATSEGIIDKDRCQFQFRARDASGEWSNFGKVNVNKAVGIQTYVKAVSRVVTINPAHPRYAAIELKARFGADANGDVTFYISKLPRSGALYDTPEMGLTPSSEAQRVFINNQTGVAVIRAKASRNVRLTYALPNDAIVAPFNEQLEYFVSNGDKNSTIATITIINREYINANGPLPQDPTVIGSNVGATKLTCGDTTIEKVFRDKSVVGFVLNYSTPGPVKKLQLVSVSNAQLGTLIRRLRSVEEDASAPAVVTTNTKLQDPRPIGAPQIAIHVGEFFSDEKGALMFVPNISATFREGDTVKLTYRVYSQSEENCLATLNFIFARHHAGPLQQWESGRSGLFTLIPLFDTNNISDALDLRTITSLPTQGELFELTENSTITIGKNDTSVRSVGSRHIPYCEVFDCVKEMGKKLSVGSVVTPRSFFNSRDSASSAAFTPKLPFVLYRSFQVRDSTSRQPREDSFLFDCGEATHTVRIWIKTGYLRRVEVRYKPRVRSPDDFIFNRRDPIQVLVNLSSELPEKKEICVLEPRGMFRHGSTFNFDMYQYDGVRSSGRYVVGEPLAGPIPKHGIPCRWINPQNHSLVIIPRSDTNRQVFRFRARIFSIPDDGIFDPEAFEDIRVDVVRDNHPPTWGQEPPEGRPVKVGEFATMYFSVEDDDNDDVTFVVSTPPAHGELWQLVTVLGKEHRTKIRPGQRMAIPRGSAERLQLALAYQTHRPTWTSLPAVDFFTIYADDGGEQLSKALRVKMTILEADPRDLSTKRLPSAYIAFAAVGAGIILIVILTVVLVRKRAKARYMQLPKGATGAADVEMS